MGIFEECFGHYTEEQQIKLAGQLNAITDVINSQIKDDERLKRVKKEDIKQKNKGGINKK